MSIETCTENENCVSKMNYEVEEGDTSVLENGDASPQDITPRSDNRLDTPRKVANNLVEGSVKFHRETENFLALLQENNLTDPFSQFTPSEARERSNRISQLCNSSGTFAFDGKAKDFTIPCPQRDDGIPVTVYDPGQLGFKPTIVVYFHGVGMMWGSREVGSEMCCRVAQSCGCIVVSVEYSLPPESKITSAIDDAICAVRWVVFNKGLIGAKHNSSVGVMGDSGGGLIAAQAAQELMTVSFQILLYPKLTMRMDHASCLDENNEGPLCTSSDVQRFVRDCIGQDNSTKLLERCNPGNREHCSSVPPALFVIAEYDPVKDEAHDYIKKLKEAKVRTTTVTVKGTIHGFFHLPSHFKSCCQKALDRIGDFIKSHSNYNHLHLLN